MGVANLSSEVLASLAPAEDFPKPLGQEMGWRKNLMQIRLTRNLLRLIETEKTMEVGSLAVNYSMELVVEVGPDRENASLPRAL